MAETSSTAPRTRPVVGVMGSGSHGHAYLAVPLGTWIAQHGYHLLTGGGMGVMEEVAKAFCATHGRVGMSIAVIPGHPRQDGVDAPNGYPNPWVELCIRTHLPLSGPSGTHPLSRNHVNVLSSQVVVALPGGEGTGSEVELARRYGTPVIVWAGSPDTDPPWLHAGTPWTRDFEEVTRFVVTHAPPWP